MNPFKTLLIPTVIRNLGAALKKLSAAVTAKNDHVEPQILVHWACLAADFGQNGNFPFCKFVTYHLVK